MDGPARGLPDASGGGGRLVTNIMHFARVLRTAGLPIGPGHVLDAVRALECVGITRRDDFYWTLHAVFVNRRDQRGLFDQAFHVFWKNPKILEQMMALLLPEFRAPPNPEDEDRLSTRLADALFPAHARDEARARAEDEVVLDAAFSYSPSEVLRETDFEQMTADEEALAKALIKRMVLPLARLKTRRFAPDPRGRRFDLRRSLRAGLRAGGEWIPLARRRRRTRPPALVIICDISGSMSRYSRMLLHFMHAVTNDRDRVHSFVFGTRLTNITRQLRYRDIDQALDKVADGVDDWSGGTRLGHCLADFNKNWARRVLGQGPLVLLITDGLDRDAGDGVGREMDRLHRSCRRLVWLNPLLRYDAYEAKAKGAEAMAAHVDDLRAVHNLNSLGDLVAVLGKAGKY